MMKTFVKAKADYKPDLATGLHEGEIYEVIAILETDKVNCGKAVVIDLQQALAVYDFELFFE